jgi:hypothetical protein
VFLHTAPQRIQAIGIGLEDDYRAAKTASKRDANGIRQRIRPPAKELSPILRIQRLPSLIQALQPPERASDRIGGDNPERSRVKMYEGRSVVKRGVEETAGV